MGRLPGAVEVSGRGKCRGVRKLRGCSVTFYDIDVEELKSAYTAEQQKNGTNYDTNWIAAIDAAKAAVQ